MKTSVIVLLVLLAALGLANATAGGNGCEATLFLERHGIENLFYDHWEDFDKLTINAAAYNRTEAQIIANSSLFFATYWVDATRFIVPSSNPAFDVNITGTANLIAGLAFLTTISGGELRTFSPLKITCTDGLNYKVKAKMHAFTRPLIDDVTFQPIFNTNGFIVSTSHLKLQREHANAPFKVLEVYNEIVESIIISVNGSATWKPVTI